MTPGVRGALPLIPLLLLLLLLLLLALCSAAENLPAHKPHHQCKHHRTSLHHSSATTPRSPASPQSEPVDASTQRTARRRSLFIDSDADYEPLRIFIRPRLNPNRTDVDPRTQAVMDVMTEDIVPYFAAHFSMEEPERAPVNWSYIPQEHCGPPVNTTGTSDVDPNGAPFDMEAHPDPADHFLLYLTVVEDALDPYCGVEFDLVAYTLICNRFEDTGRPVVATITLCAGALHDLGSTADTTLPIILHHEMYHALGFNRESWPFYDNTQRLWDSMVSFGPHAEEGPVQIIQRPRYFQTLGPRRSDIMLLVPEATQYTRDLINCRQIEGVYLDDDAAHLKQFYYFDNMMSPMMHSETVRDTELADLILAASPWYALHTTQETRDADSVRNNATWARNLGCQFTWLNCKEFTKHKRRPQWPAWVVWLWSWVWPSGAASPPPQEPSVELPSPFCFDSHTPKCGVYQYEFTAPAPVPRRFRYFGARNGTLGGMAQLQWCPILDNWREVYEQNNV